jgi:hypothetical protein
VIWVAVGGRGTLVGAALGAVVVNYAKTVFTSGPLAPYWLFMLGALFILVDVAAAEGDHRHLQRLVGGTEGKTTIGHCRKRRARRRRRRTESGGVSA